MAIHRITAEWSGFQGAPGYTNFHFMAGGGLISDAQSSVDRVRAFFTSIANFLPNTVQIDFQADVEEIDESTGIVQTYQSVDPGDPIAGEAAGSYSAPTGGVINWRTNDLRNGRRIRGRTFIVPLSENSYAFDGTLVDSARSRLLTAGGDLLGGDLDSELVVWSRPVNGSGGVAATVTQCTVPDMAAVLRSRRD